MTPNPILKVLSTLRAAQVRHLLMGGQACVLYGAATFSKDTDIAVLAEPANIASLRQALADLQAECIAVPPFSIDYLQRGFAIHFRARHPEASNTRIDVMSEMRGVAPFSVLWERRTTLTTSQGESIDLLSLADLVQAKKTQRDKDWPMLRRLIETHYNLHRQQPTREQIDFWLCEARTPSILRELVQRFPSEATAMESARPLLVHSILDHEESLANALVAEEQHEREADRLYWQPRRAELEKLRLKRARRKGS